MVAINLLGGRRQEVVEIRSRAKRFFWWAVAGVLGAGLLFLGLVVYEAGLRDQLEGIEAASDETRLGLAGLEEIREDSVLVAARLGEVAELVHRRELTEEKLDFLLTLFGGPADLRLANFGDELDLNELEVGFGADKIGGLLDFNEFLGFLVEDSERIRRVELKAVNRDALGSYGFSYLFEFARNGGSRR